MTLLMLLEMVVSALADRTAVGSGRERLTYQELHERAGRGASVLAGSGARHLAYLGVSDVAFPVAVFAAAWAGIPFLPLNYRLGIDQLRQLLDAHDDVLILADTSTRGAVEGLGAEVMTLAEWNDATADPAAEVAEPSASEGDDIAVLLYTSGTTSAPKAVVLRHRHLTSYVISSVEFAASADDDATLVSVPPYHVAGVATVLSNIYSGRRLVYLADFTPQGWLDTVREEGITHAMVVPTMLARIVDHLDDHTSAATPSLRSLAYGGARAPANVVGRALEAFPDTNFVNAYGLTETSSTIAVLGPEEHRSAFTSKDPSAQARLASVGRLVPGIKVEIRDELGNPVEPGVAGEIFVRGEQVSGEYLGREGALDAQGWFATRDRGHVDDEGYLFIEGRADDTIIRGGENIAPAEIEDVLLQHPAVAGAAVVGIPDEEWGQQIAAVIVPKAGPELDVEELREWARERLRSSKTPTTIVVRDELPVTETGKLLRRVLVEELSTADASSAG